MINNYISTLIFIINCHAISAQIQKDDIILQAIDNPVKFVDNDLYYVVTDMPKDDTKVDVKLYYECLCNDCMEFYKYPFASVVEKLGQYLNVHTYPYGNAKTEVNDGKIEFKCQHGPLECYGNKLHACAIDEFQNITKAVIFNACMMDPKDRSGSDDLAADMCATELMLDSKPIKDCAKGDRGTMLLKEYGSQSKKANFKYVPYILIDDKLNDGENFMKDVCDAFPSPPPPCL